jgi:hypothetical protein
MSYLQSLFRPNVKCCLQFIPSFTASLSFTQPHTGAEAIYASYGRDTRLLPPRHPPPAAVRPASCGRETRLSAA